MDIPLAQRSSCVASVAKPQLVTNVATQMVRGMCLLPLND